MLPTRRAALDDTELPPAKKPRLSDAHQLVVQDEEAFAVKLGQTPVLQHPAPRRPHASFLHDPADSVLAWLASDGLHRDTRCRSDSHPHPENDAPLRQRPRSAPAMSHAGDAAMPGTTASAQSRLWANASSTLSWSSPGQDLVATPDYRRVNFRVRQDRDSPVPALDALRTDKVLDAVGLGVHKTDVAAFCRARFFPASDPTGGLKRSERQPMAKQAVPASRQDLKISTPVPDMIYGYDHDQAFPNHQVQLSLMGRDMMADNQPVSSAYPFVIVEFRGDGVSMWSATNQCLGGSASCVNLAEALNRRLRQSSIHPIDSSAFSIAMNGSEARLFISWKHDETDYYMAKVDTFALQRPEHYVEFRKYVRNIIDWGMGERLEGIRTSLDSLVDKNRKAGGGNVLIATG